MPIAIQALMLLLWCGAIVLLAYKPVAQNVQQAMRGWRHNPKQMLVKLLLGFAFGQMIFWFLGYDQLGFFMRPLKQFGLGQPIAAHIAAWLPATAAVAWTVKGVEIFTDTARIFIEGRVYKRSGFVPDVVATLVTAPLWVCYEVAEKITGATLHPERVTTQASIVLSIACIYGNVFRYGLDALLYFKGNSIYRGFGRLAHLHLGD